MFELIYWTLVITYISAQVYLIYSFIYSFIFVLIINIQWYNIDKALLVQRDLEGREL